MSIFSALCSFEKSWKIYFSSQTTILHSILWPVLHNFYPLQHQCYVQNMFTYSPTIIILLLKTLSYICVSPLILKILRYEFCIFFKDHTQTVGQMSKNGQKSNKTFKIDSVRNNFKALFGLHFQLKGLDDSLCYVASSNLSACLLLLGL